MLNRDIWDNERLRPEVKERLLAIAMDYLKESDVDLGYLKDIVITGSMANHNWHDQSDIDLHIILDFEEVSSDPETLNRMFRAEREVWNRDHDIHMYGHEVEIYVQDESQPHVEGSGVYSVVVDEWVQYPTEDAVNTSPTATGKACAIMSYLKKIESYQGHPCVFECASFMLEKLSRLREKSIEREGEFAEGNLIYKLVRKSGWIDKLHQIKNQSYDARMGL